MYLDIIFFAILAVFVLYRLFDLLGTHSDQDSQDQSGSFFSSSRQMGEEGADFAHQERMRKAESQVSYLEAEVSTDDLHMLKKYDKSFSMEMFIKGAIKAFEMVISAFAKGDKETLKMLLHKDIFEGFDQAITEREAKGESLETKILDFKSVRVESVRKERHLLLIEVHFATEQSNIIRDSKGEVIAGDELDIETVKDVWTFGRNPASKNPNWLLIETDRITESD